MTFMVLSILFAHWLSNIGLPGLTRYDYFPQLKRFVLRMADDLHECVVEQFKTQILEQLFIIKQSNDQVAADFARKIIPRELIWSTGKLKGWK